MCALWKRCVPLVPTLIIHLPLPCREDEETEGTTDYAARQHSRILHTSLGLTVAANANKLSLVVDLDQTVLHATVDPSVAPICSQRNDIHRVVLPEAPDQTYFIKLRPHLGDFLQRMAKLFELHVYTMGSRNYARAVVKLFDQDGALFYDRILSRDDSGIDDGSVFHKKDLKRIFPADDSTVLVIDDRADVWNYSPNLIPVSPYTFFVGVGDINRAIKTGSTPSFLLSEDDKESKSIGVEDHAEAIVVNDTDGDLLLIEKANEGSPVDVKRIVDERRKSVLSGVSLVFSGIIPIGLSPHNFELWRLAETFGALCEIKITPSTTHLISLRNDTDKVLQAVEAGVRVVRPEWLLNCFKTWAHVTIDEFLLNDLPSPTTSLHIDQSQLASMAKEIDEDSEAEAVSDLEHSDEPTDAPPDADDDDDIEEGPFKKRLRTESSDLELSILAELERELDQ